LFLQNELAYWDEVVKITRPIYNDMPYTGYTYPADGNDSVIDNTSRFHWALLRPEVAKDVEIAKKQSLQRNSEGIRQQRAAFRGGVNLALVRKTERGMWTTRKSTKYIVKGTITRKRLKIKMP